MKVWGIACALALLASGCGASDPEAEIRALLSAAEAAAEARDVGFFGDAIGASYRDSRGNDREATLRLVRGLFIANQRIEVVSRIDEVVIEGGDAARAVVHAGIVGRRTDGGLIDGLDADLYRFELELVNHGENWQVIGADFKRALGE